MIDALGPSYFDTSYPDFSSPLEEVAFVVGPKPSSSTAWERFLQENPAPLRSITERFLERYPLDQIRATLAVQEEGDGFDLEPFLPFFQYVTAQEKPGFFGYHATTMGHFVFNEIVKQVLGVDDFYFLRAPIQGESRLTDVDGFLERYVNPPRSIEEMRRFIALFFLRPLGQEQMVYDDAQAAQIYEALLFYTNIPTTTTKEEVEERLKAFIGINTPGLQAWLEDPSREEYEEGRSVEEHDFIVKTIWPLNDVWEGQRDLLVSLNISLFGNFALPGESTIRIFAQGKSIDFSSEGVPDKAAEFLMQQGVSKEIAAEIYAYAESLFDLNQGVLLQFFDDPSYSHLDKVAYVCINFGTPLASGQRVSDFLLRFDPRQDVQEGDVEGFGHYISHPQLRLLMTPQETLNPRSWLTIKEYDRVAPEKKEELRRFIAEKFALIRG